MSEYTKLIMWRIKRQFDDSGLSLQEFGQRMGYERATARKSAWQFLNSTEDPRLSMVERAAVALGANVGKLLQAPGPSQVADAVADLYVATADDVISGHLSRNEAIRALTTGTDSAIAGQTEEMKKLWNRWRVQAGHALHLVRKPDAEYAADLVNMAIRLRQDGPVVYEFS